jgi:hypothetical protein
LKAVRAAQMSCGAKWIRKPRQDMPKDFYVTLQEPDASRKHGFRERRWRCISERMPQNGTVKNWGACLPDKRQLLVHSSLDREEYISTIWHEAIHAVCPDLAEQAVLRIEHAIWQVSLALKLFAEEE